MSIAVLLSISDDAYDTLFQSAKDLLYISPYAQDRKHGISAYIEALSRATFRDTRPSDVRGMDLPLLQSNQLPFWSMELNRRPRAFRISDETFNNYYRIAAKYGITNARRGDSIEIRTSFTSAVLEAIGIGWLTPTNLEPCAHPPKGRALSRRKRYYDW